MGYDIEIRTIDRTDTAVVHKNVGWAEIAATLGAIFGDVMTYLTDMGVGTTGMAFGRYEPQGETVTIEAGFSTAGPIEGDSHVVPGELPGGEVATCVFVGPYEDVAKVYEAIEGWVAAQGRQIGGAPWESYLSMPDENPPRTEIFFPLAPIESTASARGR